MAEHLASIFGTEKDRVNCPFYFKIGACRHGDRCSRLHTKPSISPTLLLSNMYQRPDIVTPGVDAQGQPIDPRKIQTHFDDFYQDLFDELSKYGRLQTLNVCDNLADHMVGNVYAQFREEEHAAEALKNLTGRFYAGNPIIVDFSPVTDFREATCRQYEEDSCNRGGYCNFMHLKKISRELRRELFGMDNRGRHGRSRSPDRHRSNEDRSPRGHSRKYDERSHHHESRGRRRRSNSPGHRRGRSRSPRGSRERRPARDGSEERRARIEQWNREREEQKHESKVSTEENNAGNNGHVQDSNEQWNREREEQKHESKVSTEENNDGNNGHVQDGNEHHDYQQQQQQPLEGGYDY
ncbi:splicing factor U2af small subunit B-like [Lotus japonicus]|uniref:splicing factor U2af small subunit B-like n=1 Tax=Lotus japonicus TaxID=34305 RepID=UPI00258AFAD9|nr:splicing factor U2af small subunit B-like [Lotus japonicus]XP_057456024.1 splicing factor U2af small subunit B-like [Lotus japonicus]XP_057456025.1 splicing factor U2af small subunit B-like [Lotus japonicus]XP_057456026.1 splicing factor U2af small subunit B-like [Lotus japonicus]XP_057456027.1 splicing factor U2af small subunit B-like [Lotus japonicus]